MRLYDIASADLDSDGDVDVLVATDETLLLWYENQQQGTKFLPHHLTEDPMKSSELTTGDVDGDGDIDFVGSYISAPDTETLYWLENLDGRGTFGQPRLVDSGGFSTSDIELADLDGDGLLDVVTVGGYFGFGIGAWWYRNQDGGQTFGDMEFLGAPGYQAVDVEVGDIDGVNGLDVLVVDPGLPGEGLAPVVGWYPNLGRATFGPPEIVLEITPIALYFPQGELGDLDADGDLDFVLSHEGGLFWMENDGSGIFGEWQFIQETRLRLEGIDVTTRGHDVVDLDGDNDLDVVVSVGLMDGCDCQSYVVWYENQDGNGNFGEAQVVGLLSGAVYGLYFVISDFDGDQDNDVFASSGFGGPGTLLFRSHLTPDGLPWVGDVNADGSVGFGDFLLLSSNYGATDAVWAEGDMDGNGTVDFADLLLLAANFGNRLV